MLQDHFPRVVHDVEVSLPSLPFGPDRVRAFIHTHTGVVPIGPIPRRAQMLALPHTDQLDLGVAFVLKRFVIIIELPEPGSAETSRKVAKIVKCHLTWIHTRSHRAGIDVFEGIIQPRERRRAHQ